MLEIPGPTNVASLRMGRGALHGLASELGTFVVSTMDIPWSIAGPILGGEPAAVHHVDSVEQRALDVALASLPSFDTAVGVGGGQAIDTAKYFAWRRGTRLVSVPTILSVDAFVTPAAGIRRDHEVVYLGETSPDPLVIDFDVIRTAPTALNVAGAGDILSIHTATFDWEIAHRAAASEYRFDPGAISRARGILADIAGMADDVRHATDNGLRALVEAYMRINTICLPAGHYRVEEGSEHFLFYELEERLKRPFVHGHIVGLGIYLMSLLQNNRHKWITGVMDRIGLRYQPADMGITRPQLTASLQNLRRFVQDRERLWYSVIDESPITSEWIESAIQPLSFTR